MRKFIIDTDTGSDDAVAILMALLEPDVEILALTTVSGNVPVEQATLNCLMCAEISGRNPMPPVYMGADRPMIRKAVHAHNVHGADGMGDCGLIHPTLKAVEGVHAADAIIKLVEENPDEVEIAVIGPVTNVALAMMKAPKVMQRTKRIWSMGTPGFGYGNTTPVSEFNVYADAEAYRVMMDFGVPVTIVGYDLCDLQNAWNEEDTKRLLASGKETAVFAIKCNAKLLEYATSVWGEPIIDLPDPIAVGCMLWPEMVKDSIDCVSHVCIGDDPVTYGQVVLYTGKRMSDMNGFGSNPYGKSAPDCTVITKIDGELYKKKLEETLCR